MKTGEQVCGEGQVTETGGKRGLFQCRRGKVEKSEGICCRWRMTMNGFRELNGLYI